MTRNPDAVANVQSGAVNRRADVLPGRAATKAHKLDIQFCGTLDDDTGPVARRLNAFGPVRGLVVGHWAEGSRHLKSLLTGAAYCGSQRHWTSMRAREPRDANGTLAWLLRRRWGMTFWRSTARLLIDRLAYVGRGSVKADGRRADASEAAAAARRAAHWLFRSTADADLTTCCRCYAEDDLCSTPRMLALEGLFVSLC